MVSPVTDQAEVVPDRPRPCFREGPPADDTCEMTRVVRRRGTRFEVWTCTDPQPTIRVKLDANRFPAEDAKRWWPGCASAWYDALYHPDHSCTPGRTQFVVYDGEGGRRERGRTRGGKAREARLPPRSRRRGSS